MDLFFISSITFLIYRFFLRKRFLHWLNEKNFIRSAQWSIGIYTGKTLSDLKPAKHIQNPVISADDLRSVGGYFAADPFMISESGKWYLFFEMLNISRGRGEIGLAISENGMNWNFQGVVLKEMFHLSFPSVFKDKNSFYMTPESFEKKEIRLYQAKHFPFDWTYIKTLVRGKDFVDPCVFFHDQRWWLFASNTGNSHFFIYYADELLGEWHEHSKNGIKMEGKARLAGPVTLDKNRLIRFAQIEQNGVYGVAVSAFEILKLSPTEYEEIIFNQSRLLQGSGQDWNALGMHHIHPHKLGDQWVACVDGFRNANFLTRLVAEGTFWKEFIKRKTIQSKHTLCAE